MMTSIASIAALFLQGAGLAAFFFSALPDDFNGEKAEEKMGYIVEKLEEDKSSGPWTDGGIRIFIKPFLSQTQDHEGDELPSCRGNRKYIHSVGAVVKTRSACK